MWRYIGRKLGIYGITFVVAVTINWMIPRFMPGDPVRSMLSRASVSDPEALERMTAYYNEVFGLDTPLHQQYFAFWAGLFRGDLGVSVWLYPEPVVDIILRHVPFTLGLLLPAIILSWIIGNRLGAFAARSKVLDNTVLPIGYILTATPYMWLALLLAWALGVVGGFFPTAGGYSFALTPSWTWGFFTNLVSHWFLPFLSMFVVALGGWAIGMRNMIIYELEADYSNYLQALGAPRRLIRRYAFRNAMLPQITGLAVQLGTIIAGALLTEVVFNYPGLGTLILNSLNNNDFFLLQGIFLFVVVGVLIANFIIDIVYVLVDPRTRVRMTGGAS
ncbi:MULTISPECIES: ABC transporter permease [Nocardiopsis]|uniref:ABC transporter permease n=2 Tax=Nocardiopsis alba TaxID=53437 RepID=A0A7K2IQ36_9ACTN|nr:MULTISPECIES: ABC transporter permease [Nocardiopsis]AFR06150.1 binding--dependent transport system inner membrane component family protein [Nocardiopsis alba ATCC BAA-2165]MEC3893202.1 ABC transporter permease [Nocardiopsis sp. LDBS1602]MYR31904.1 ABC transporter permease subunit [Nocardiopsis alba]